MATQYEQWQEDQREIQYAEFLKDIGMTQEQYDDYLKKQAEDEKQRRNAKIAKNRVVKPKR